MSSETVKALLKSVGSTASIHPIWIHILRGGKKLYEPFQTCQNLRKHESVVKKRIHWCCLLTQKNNKKNLKKATIAFWWVCKK